MPAPVISPLTLLAFPAVLVLANAIAAIPARAAAPYSVLRTTAGWVRAARPTGRPIATRPAAGG